MCFYGYRRWVLKSKWIALAMAVTLYATTALCEEFSRATQEPAPRTEAEEQMISAYRKFNEAVVNIGTKAEVMDMFGTSHQEGDVYKRQAVDR